jgi:hypothetical protein
LGRFILTDKAWPRLRKILRTGDSYNREVYEWFKDANDIPNRKTLRDYLLITAKDSRTTAMAKMQFFREQVQKTHLRGGYFVGTPKSDFDESVIYKPEVTLYFQQNKESVPKGKTAKNARISYRLMNETSSSLTKTELKNLAKKIYDDFATPIYRFNKGKVISWYVSPSEGLHLQIYGHTEEIGETVIKKVLSHRNLTFDNNIFKSTTPKRNSDSTPGTVNILGEPREKPVWRPTVFVEFEHASINLHNDNVIRILCDVSGLYPNPVYKP